MHLVGLRTVSLLRTPPLNTKIKNSVSVLQRCVFVSVGGWGRGGRAGGGGGRGNFGVILVRVCEPVFQNLPYSYTWPLKKRTHSYT